MENYKYVSEMFGSGLSASNKFNEYVKQHPNYEFVSMCPVGVFVMVVFRYKVQ